MLVKLLSYFDQIEEFFSRYQLFLPKDRLSAERALDDFLSAETARVFTENFCRKTLSVDL